MLNFMRKERNRKIARKEHESIEKVYYLPFNAELQARLSYKKSLLVNDIFEHLNLDRDSFIDIVNVEKMITGGMENGMIDMFYNKIMDGEIVQ